MVEDTNHTIFWVGDMNDALHLSADVNTTLRRASSQTPDELFFDSALLLENNLIDEPLVPIKPNDRIALVILEPEDAALEQVERVVHSARERFASTRVALAVVDLTGRMLGADASFPDSSTHGELSQFLQTHLYPSQVS